jgi:hypothetical protein
VKRYAFHNYAFYNDRILNITYFFYSIDNMPNASSVATFTASVVSSPYQAVDGLATSRYNLKNRGRHEA